MNTLIESDIRNDRLWRLMKDNGITDCRMFARKLIDSGIYTSFSDLGNKNGEYGSSEVEQYKKNVDSLSKIIQRCLKNNQYQNDNLLIACCQFFNCSSDYLLGFIPLPTHGKTDFNDLTGLSDNCIDTLTKCNKRPVFDNSFAEYNQNIILLLNYLLYQDKADQLVNNSKITLLNDIFNYLVFSDFDSYTDNDGFPQGSHVTFIDKNNRSLCRLPVSSMHNAIKLNINSILDTLKDHVKESGFYILQKPSLGSLFDEIKENQSQIDKWDEELNDILENGNPKEKKKYIGVLVGCKNMRSANIRNLENAILSNYKDILQTNDFSCFPEWQKDILERIYKENEYYVTDKM